MIFRTLWRLLSLLLFVNINVCLAINCTSGTSEQGIIFATTNSSVLLNCSSTDTTIAWYKNNVPISSTPSRTITNEGNLNLSDVQSTEAGWYTCSSAGGLVEDFLLIVGDKPSPVVDRLPYTVLPGSRVEFSCISTAPGTPFPQAVWRDRFGSQLEDSNTLVHPVTRSLIITNFTEAMTGEGYKCQLCNQFDTVESLAPNVTVSSMSQEYSSPLDDMTTPISLPPNQQLTLTCVKRDKLDSLNYTVQWFKDLQSVSEGKTRLTFDSASPSDSGYYCCHVLRDANTLVSRHCVTLWVRGSSRFTNTLPGSVVTLPSGAGRRLLLDCSAAPLRYDTPTVTWSRDGKPLLSSIGVQVYGHSPVGFNFVRVGDVTTEGGSTHVYTCALNNSLNESSVSITVTAVELCEGGNIVNDTRDASARGSPWMPSNSNAKFAFVNNEYVLELNYSEPDTVFTQTLRGSLVTAVHISGRMRQVSPNVTQRGSAALMLIAGGETFYLPNPDNTSEAWQWVGRRVQFSQPVDQMVLRLLVVADSEVSLSGMAYFDDLCVSVISTAELLIGASVGGGLLLLLLLLLVCVTCCCCLCRRSKKQASMMKKMSVKMRKKWSRKYDATESQVALDSYNRSSPPPPPEERVYDSVGGNNYINPENYQYVNQQIVVETTVSDGQYTALDPKTVEEHTYATATPASHRSMTSLHNVDTGYVDVGAGVRAGYLEVLPPTHLSGSLPTSPEEVIYDNDVRSRSATTPAELDPVTGFKLHDNVNHDV